MIHYLATSGPRIPLVKTLFNIAQGIFEAFGLSIFTSGRLFPRMDIFIIFSTLFLLNFHSLRKILAPMLSVLGLLIFPTFLTAEAPSIFVA